MREWPKVASGVGARVLYPLVFANQERSVVRANWCLRVFPALMLHRANLLDACQHIPDVIGCFYTEAKGNRASDRQIRLDIHFGRIEDQAGMGQRA